MASFNIRFGASAEEELRGVPFPFRRQIIQAIHKLKQTPVPDFCELQTEGLWSLPVYGYQIVYELEADTITIVRIGR